MKKSTSAKLLRIFLPTTLLITVVESFLLIRVFPHFNVHPVIAVVLISIIFIIIVIFIISIISKSIGKNLDSALENLSYSENLFRNISENAPVLINSFDEKGKCLFWNEQCIKTFGWTMEEINQSKVPMELFYPDAATREKVLNTFLSDSDGSFKEWHPIASDGRLLSVMWANFRLPNGQIFSIGHDITERKLVEKDLKESDERFRLAFNQQFILMATISPEGYTMDINDLPLKLQGLKREDYIGKLFWKSPTWENSVEWQEKIKNNVMQALSMEEPLFTEDVFFSKDGNKHNALVIYNAIRDTDNNVNYLLLQAMDITERKQTDELLLQNKNRLDYALNTIETGAWELNLQTLQSWRSLKHDQIFGYDEPLPEWTFDMFLSHVVLEDRAEVNEKFQKAVTTKKDWNFECRIEHPNGAIRWIWANGNQEINKDNESIKMFGIVQDITERKLAEKALYESEKYLKNTFDLSPSIISTANLNTGHFTKINKAVTRILGYSVEEFTSKPFIEFIHPDDRQKLINERSINRKDNKISFFENRYLCSDGSYKWISWHTTKADENGMVTAIGTDITDMMQVQEAIMAKNKEMENYLYIASHDLRSPLVNIHGFSQRLKKQADSIKMLFEDKTLEPETLLKLNTITDEDIPKTLNFVLSNIEKMDILINGLLQLSRTGRIKMNIQKINMNAVFSKILHNLDFQIKEAQCNILIDTLPECYGDPELLDQLFENIISNALKYSDSERPLEITINATKEHNKVVYTIKDNGKGMAQKYLEKIWDIFYRVDPRSGKTGEGIGLSLVKQITEKHKGKVWVNSEENKGSIFYIELHNRIFSEL